MKPPVKTIISVFLSVIMTFSVIVTANASEVTEEPTGALSTPKITSVTNEGPVGRKITWTAIKGATYYRVFYINAKGKWAGLGNTKQTFYYDAAPKAAGDTYTVRCIDKDSSNWKAMSGYDTKGYTITAKCQSSDVWLKNKQIKVAGAEVGWRSNATAKAGFYSDIAGTKKICDIPNGTILTVIEVTYANNKKDCFNTRFKVKYNNKTGYVKMNYALVNVNQFLPSADIALSFASNRSYTWHKANRGLDNGLYNMFNYKGSTNYIKGITDQKFYSSNTAWMRYDALKYLTNAQIVLLKNGYRIKINDAFRPHNVTAKIDPAWDRYIAANKLTEKSSYGASLTNQIASPSYVSKHNTGQAVDITLINKNGEQLVMPTLMHDLSWNAEYSKWCNSTTTGATNAKYLRKIMTERGFGTYIGEWWHFEYTNPNVIPESARIVYDCNN